MTLATWDDAKACKLCSKGMRDWFAQKDRGMTYLEFIKNGATVEWLRAQEDGMADKLADYAERK